MYIATCLWGVTHRLGVTVIAGNSSQIWTHRRDKLIEIQCDLHFQRILLFLSVIKKKSRNPLRNHRKKTFLSLLQCQRSSEVVCTLNSNCRQLLTADSDHVNGDCFPKCKQIQAKYSLTSCWKRCGNSLGTVWDLPRCPTVAEAQCAFVSGTWRWSGRCVKGLSGASGRTWWRAPAHECLSRITSATAAFTSCSMWRASSRWEDER